MKKTIYTMVMLMIFALAGESFATNAKTVSGVVNVNTASKAELVLIPGIGAAKADAILVQRGEQAFTSTEDLLAVKGIGEKILEKIAPYIVLQGETTIQPGETARN